MATQYGAKIAVELIKRGWKLAPPDSDVYGDPVLIDPITGILCNPYYAAEIEKRRNPKFWVITNRPLHQQLRTTMTKAPDDNP